MFDFLRKAQREPPALPAGTVRRHYLISGQVQGVGFRYRARYAADSLGLTGWVENLDDGRVEMEVQGLPEAIDRLFPMVQASDYILISDVSMKEISPSPRERGFSVRGY